jgi:hypothetical protein
MVFSRDRKRRGRLQGRGFRLGELHRRHDEIMPVFCPTSQTHFVKSAGVAPAVKPLEKLAPATVHGVVFAFFVKA